jgi:1,2-phenylacetyl-CoA epoxidase catalytic subunit
MRWRRQVLIFLMKISNLVWWQIYRKPLSETTVLTWNLISTRYELAFHLRHTARWIMRYLQVTRLTTYSFFGR